MNILLLTPYYPNDINPSGGIFIHHQAVALKRLGHKVHVYHFVRKLPFWQKALGSHNQRKIKSSTYKWDDIDVTRFTYYWPSQKFFDRGWATAIARAFRKNFRQHETFDPHVIYAQWLLPTGAAAAQIKSKECIPIVAIARGQDLDILATRSNALQNDLKIVFEKSDRVLVNNEWGIQRLKDLGFNAHNNNVEIIRNIKELSLFTSLNLDREIGDISNIITVASLERYKGIDVLIQACSKLEKGFHLTIIGDGSKRIALECQCKDLGIDNSITFRGILSQNEIADEFAKSTLFVLPSRRDAAPNALVEAMSAGLACIASSVGGIPFLIQDEISGLLVPKGNPDALAKAINRLLISNETCQRLGKNARIQISKMYSYEKNLDKLEEILLSIYPTIQ